MAFTGQLGTIDSQLGSIEPGFSQSVTGLGSLSGNAASSFSDLVVPTILRPLIGAATVTSIGAVSVTSINVQTPTNQFRVDLLNGLHAFGPSVIRATTTKDTFKAALYVTTATRGPNDTIYTTSGEVSGTGYTAGGVTVINIVPPTLSGSIAYWSPSSPITFTSITLTTAFDCLLLYNNTSSAKLAVAVFVFAAQTITAGDFILFAANNEVSGLIRLTDGTNPNITTTLTGVLATNALMSLIANTSSGAVLTGVLGTHGLGSH